jgi:hypothetical protein
LSPPGNPAILIEQRSDKRSYFRIDAKTYGRAFEKYTDDLIELRNELKQEILIQPLPLQEAHCGFRRDRSDRRSAHAGQAFPLMRRQRPFARFWNRSATPAQSARPNDAGADRKARRRHCLSAEPFTRHPK